MKLKKFNDYSLGYSKDPKNFEKRVTFASPTQTALEIFDQVSNPFDFKNGSIETPVVLWDGFSFDFTQINEKAQFFNRKSIPTSSEIAQKYSGLDFMPKSTNVRKEVKGLRFPIIGDLGKDSQEFKTYGKFRKSEKSFSNFREKIVPRTKFDVLTFRDEPIHVEERINKLGFDVNIGSFEFLNESKKIANLINREYGPDFYKIRLLEANGLVYLDSIVASGELSPAQYLKMYEMAYENSYHSKLPNWFKVSLFEKHVIPFYKKRAYDSRLIKPKHSINFEKYLAK